jgi:hypothetical protein
MRTDKHGLTTCSRAAELDIKPRGAKAFYAALNLFLHLPGKCVRLTPFSRSGYGKRFQIRCFPKPQQSRQAARAEVKLVKFVSKLFGLDLV